MTMSSSGAQVGELVGAGRSVLAVVAACAVVLGLGAGPAIGAARVTNGPIAFIRFVGDESHLVLIDADGSAEREVPLPGQAALPAWSPDGRRIALSTFAEGTIRPLIVDPRTGAATMVRVPEAPLDLALLCRTWTPDGRRLVCEGDSFSATHPESNGVYSMRVDGSGLRRLTWDAFPPLFGDEGTCGGGDVPGSVSPDGAWVVVLRARCGTLPAPDLDQEAALFLAPADGTGALVQLTSYGVPWSHEEGLGRWSPDGTRILFATADGDLATIRPDGTHLQKVHLRVPGDHPFAIAPDWSPDGSRIVFNLFLQGGVSGLHVAEADGDNLTLLVPHGVDFVNTPDWGAATR
jgi:Tol biopolymer transport system component